MKFLMTLYGCKLFNLVSFALSYNIYLDSCAIAHARTVTHACAVGILHMIHVCVPMGDSCHF